MRSSGNETARRDARGRSAVRVALTVPIMAVAAIVFAGACQAEDEAQVKAGVTAWRSSGCSECHGAFADGEKERDEAPTGANLRTTRLDDATIAETIRCGRPGTGMPSFGEDAYARGCYGQPAGPAPDDLQPAPRKLGAPEITAIVAYLRARVIGHGPVTPQECAFYYGENAASFCDGPK
jgi:mono/diheme cytochrome c family protein